jgi:hypothetical protein
MASAAQDSVAAAGDMPLGRLQVLAGPASAKELELKKAPITLGKPGVQVAVISRHPQGYFLIYIEGDSASRWVPVVNGESIGSEAYPLKDNDTIELAGIKMRSS